MICRSHLKTVRFSVGLLLSCSLLTGCKTLDEYFRRDDVKAGCPALKEYSQDTLNRVSVELPKLGPGSATSALVKDYKSLREACRTQ